MQKTKVFRLSGCLVSIGAFILFCTGSTILISIIIAITGTAVTGVAAFDIEDRAKSDAVAKLNQIDGLPSFVILDFNDDGMIRDATLAGIGKDHRKAVHHIMESYNLQLNSGVAATGIAAVMGGSFVIFVILCSLGLSAIGFILVLRKKVWKCNRCGYLYERG